MNSADLVRGQMDVTHMLVDDVRHSSEEVFGLTGLWERNAVNEDVVDATVLLEFTLGG